MDGRLLLHPKEGFLVTAQGTFVTYWLWNLGLCYLRPTCRCVLPVTHLPSTYLPNPVLGSPPPMEQCDLLWTLFKIEEIKFSLSKIRTLNFEKFKESVPQQTECIIFIFQSRPCPLPLSTSLKLCVIQNPTWVMYQKTLYWYFRTVVLALLDFCLLCFEHEKISIDEGFPNLGAVVILSQMILRCEGCPLHCRTFSCSPGLHPLGVSSNSPSGRQPNVFLRG